MRTRSKRNRWGAVLVAAGGLLPAGCGSEVAPGTVFTVAPPATSAQAEGSVPVTDPPVSEPTADDAPMASEEFCAALTQPAEAGAAPTPGLLDAVADLTRRAPTPELGAALETLLPFLKQLSKDDPGATFPAAVDLLGQTMLEPDLAVAFETLESYRTGVCGLPRSEDSPQELERDRIAPAVEAAVGAALAAADPGASISSRRITSSGSTVSVGLAVAGADFVDLFAVCRAALSPLAEPGLLNTYSVTLTRGVQERVRGTVAGGCTLV